MSNKNNLSLKDLIKEKLDEVYKVFHDKEAVEDSFREVVDSFSEILGENIRFEFKTQVDQYSDKLTAVYAAHPKSPYMYKIFTYDFDNKNVFPVKIISYYDKSWLCASLIEVQKAIKSMVSDSDFMIRIISISRMDAERNIDENHEDIPF